MSGTYSDKQLATALRYCKGDKEKALDVLLSGELKQIEEKSGLLDVPSSGTVSTQAASESDRVSGRSSPSK